MKAEALLHDASQMLEFWEEMRDLAGKAMETDEAIESADEQRFLELKSSISKLQRGLSQETPRDLAFDEKKVAELLKNAISLQHLRGMQGNDRSAFRNDSHNIWLQLVRLEGGLEFLAAGWKPEAPKAKGIKKKKKGGKGKMIFVILAAGAAAAWYLGYFG
jgi:hypothetical protein